MARVRVRRACFAAFAITFFALLPSRTGGARA